MNDKVKDPRPKREQAISRREFARRAAVASALASIAPGAALAGASATLPAVAASPPATTANPSAVVAPQASALPKLSPESQAEIEARIQTIFSQYGSRFSDEQKTDLRRLCALAQPPLDRLRAYALDNGDGPALYLKPLVEREKNPLEKTRVGKTPSGAKP